MRVKYRIELSTDGQFVMIDNLGEEVGFYETKDAAEQDLERARNDNVMWEKAQGQVDSVIRTHMEAHGADRETARYRILSAAEAAD